MVFKSDILKPLTKQQQKKFPGYRYYAEKGKTIERSILVKCGDEIKKHRLLTIAKSPNLKLSKTGVYKVKNTYSMKIKLHVQKDMLFNGAMWLPDFLFRERWMAHDMLYTMKVCTKEVADTVMGWPFSWILILNGKFGGISSKKYAKAGKFHYLND